MIMDGPPAPSHVGREFVRQYYTLLNQAPAHLHRFYNNNSSFVHGGLDSPQRPEAKVVVGQKQIHQKIQQLNFRDCHAKISQVDSQATLGDGVVVQVTGELSNSGQPMRRFTQTFVLAAQTPKKFYVHNDIFRYQDLFSEEDADLADSEIRSEAEEDLDQPISPNPEHVIQTSQPLAPQHAYYNNASVVLGAQVVPAPPVINGSAHPDELVIPVAVIPVAPIIVPQVVAAVPLEEAHHHEEVPEVEAAPEVVALEVNEAEEVKEEEEVIAVPEPIVRQPVEPVSTEPKTYATLVKSGGPISFASAAGGSDYSPPAPTRNESQPNQQRGVGPQGPGGRGPRGPGANIRGMGRQDRDNRPAMQRHSFNDDRENRENVNNNGSLVGGGDGLERDRRRGQGGGQQGSGQQGTQMYTDSQQLFLGNLPHHATEDDLKDVFRKFGSIIDLRIHSKPNSKGGMAGNRVPNYGFVIFDNPSAVQDVLSSRPIYFPDDSSNGQKLNVEEKKTRPRHSLDGRADNNRTDNNNRSATGAGGGDIRSNNVGAGGSVGGGGGARGGMRGAPGGTNQRGGPGGIRGGFQRGGGMGPMRGTNYRR